MILLQRLNIATINQIKLLKNVTDAEKWLHFLMQENIIEFIRADQGSGWRNRFMKVIGSEN